MNLIEFDICSSFDLNRILQKLVRQPLTNRSVFFVQIRFEAREKDVQNIEKWGEQKVLLYNYIHSKCLQICVFSSIVFSQ